MSRDVRKECHKAITAECIYWPIEQEKLIENLSTKCEFQYLSVFDFYEFHGMTEHIHLRTYCEHAIPDSYDLYACDRHEYVVVD